MSQQPAGTSVRFLEVPDGLGGQRIDNFLVRELKGVPRPFIYRIIRRGEVRVNGGRVDAAFRLSDGDRIKVPPLRMRPERVAPKPPPSMASKLGDAVLEETRQLLIVNKPAGMAVHGGSKVNWGIIEVLRTLRGEGERLDLAHRLDRETSGCLVIAKSRKALRHFQELLRRGSVEKRYLALVRGSWPHGEHLVDEPLPRKPGSGSHLDSAVSKPRKATSTFRPVSLFDGASLLEVRIETGRTHQIRLHAAHLGHPVAGDRRYGHPGFNRQLGGLGLKRMFLHASSIDFELDGRQISVSAPLDTELAELLNRMETGVCR